MNKTCGVCEADKRADFLACSQAQMTGFSVDGTFGTCCVIQARHAVRIPKEYPLDTVAPIICAGTTCFRAVEETGVAECDILGKCDNVPKVRTWFVVTDWYKLLLDPQVASDHWHASTLKPMVVGYLQSPLEVRVRFYTRTIFGLISMWTTIHPKTL